MTLSLDYLNINEIKALLRTITDPRDKAIITLFLTTGLFVNELLDLTTNQIDFENKTLIIKGKRERQLPLNDQAYEALASWTRARIETPCEILFITIKGKVQGLSIASIDKMIRKYANQAGINRKINSKTLRNTFAINLFNKEITTKEAGKLLGISDYESIKRYREAADNPALKKIVDLEQTDTRTTTEKLVSKFLPIKAKPQKARTKIKEISTNPEEIIFGRDTLIKDIQSSLTKTQSTLIIGQLGIGKTHILKYIGIKENNAVYINSPTPLKELLLKICDKIDPNWKSELGTRPNAKALLAHITKNTATDKPILLIDNLDKLRAAEIETILVLLENFTILASAEETAAKLKQLWWKFNQLELKPLGEEACRSLINYLTQNMSVSDYELMETKLLNLANGLPLAIVDMTKQLSYKNVVNRKAVRGLYHEGGVKYRDWTFMLMILWGAVVMSRFIALGTHSFEGYILAGMGTSALLVVRFFVFKLR
jgi:hypothetical protein